MYGLSPELLLELLVVVVAAVLEVPVDATAVLVDVSAVDAAFGARTDSLAGLAALGSALVGVVAELPVSEGRRGPAPAAAALAAAMAAEPDGVCADVGVRPGERAVGLCTTS